MAEAILNNSRTPHVYGASVMRKYLEVSQIFLRHFFATLTMAIATTAMADMPSDTSASDPNPGWVIEGIAGVGSAPWYDGSKQHHTDPILLAFLSYQTKESGVFGLTQEGLGWRAGDCGGVCFGIAANLDLGRTEKDPKSGSLGLRRPGSSHLAGMGEIDKTAIVTTYWQGDSIIGLPLRIAASKATSSHHGALLELGTRASMNVIGMEASVSPIVTWADTKWMEAYFGVSERQAAASSFRPYSARSGLKSWRVEFSIAKQLWQDTYVGVQVKQSRLVGSARNSPITESECQSEYTIALTSRF